MTRNTSHRSGIFFVTDLGYALPTIASALEIRRKTPLARADIRIVMTDIPTETMEQIHDFLAPQGIFVDAMPKALYADFNHKLFNQTHVPISALGRFFMLDCIPDIYDRILYLDGDTWPSGDPAKLLESELPTGKFAAAEDKSYFYRQELGRTGKRIRNYFARIGINGDAGYFNSGVLLTDAGTWRELSKDAYEFFLKNTVSCMHHDQSALNAVAGGRRVRLAPRWNYLNAYFEWGLKPEASPEIIHFAGGSKPWLVSDHLYSPTYEQAFAPLTRLGINLEHLSGERLRIHNAFVRREELKSKTIFLHRIFARRQMFGQLVKSASVG